MKMKKSLIIPHYELDYSIVLATFRKEYNIQDTIPTLIYFYPLFHGF